MINVIVNNKARISSSENFKHYTYFQDWCSKQVGFNVEGFALDKDTLVKGNKVYSEDTCCFVPQEINSLMTKANARRGTYIIGVNFWIKTVVNLELVLEFMVF